MEEDKKQAEEAKRKAKQKSLLGFLQGGGGTSDDDAGSIEISLAGLFKCMLCTHQSNGDEKAQLINISDTLERLAKRLDHIEKYAVTFFTSSIIDAILYFPESSIRMDITVEKGACPPRHMITTWDRYRRKVKTPIIRLMIAILKALQLFPRINEMNWLIHIGLRTLI